MWNWYYSPCQYTAWNMIGLTRGQEKMAVSVRLFFVLFFIYCSFVHSCRLTSDLCLELKGTLGDFSNHSLDFLSSSLPESLASWQRREEKTEEGHVEWEKKTLGLVGGSSFPPHFLCVEGLSPEKDTDGEENIVYDTLLPYEQRKTSSLCWHFIIYGRACQLFLNQGPVSDSQAS